MKIIINTNIINTNDSAIIQLKNMFPASTDLHRTHDIIGQVGQPARHFADSLFDALLDVREVGSRGVIVGARGPAGRGSTPKQVRTRDATASFKVSQFLLCLKLY